MAGLIPEAKVVASGVSINWEKPPLTEIGNEITITHNDVESSQRENLINEDYIEKIISKAKAVGKQSPFVPLEDVTSKEFMGDYKNLSESFGRSSPLPTYVNMGANHIGASIHEGANGYKYVLVGKKFTDLPQGEALGVLAHEVAHADNGNTSAQIMLLKAAYKRNPADSELTKALNNIEIRADEGAGKLCKPSFLADYLDRDLASKVEILKEKTQGNQFLDKFSPDEFRLGVDIFTSRDESGTYPLTLERNERIRAMPKNTPNCISVSNSSAKVSDHHAPVSPSPTPALSVGTLGEISK